MDLPRLPLPSTLADYQDQARELVEALRTGDARAIQIFHNNHPRFLDEKIVWLPKQISDDEILNAHLTFDDALFTIARWYSFENWDRLAEWVNAVTEPGSSVMQFEAAAEAVITGNAEGLQLALNQNPELIQARSTRVTNHDPRVHGATLLHYVAANGVEGYRQKTPPNAVDIAEILLHAGAEADALAGMYGEPQTTMNMLVSSSHPANAGLQGPLVETLLDHGASADGRPGVQSPLMTALAHSFLETAQLLVRRGAQVNTLSAAAGLGRIEDAILLLPHAESLDRHRALALASQLGHLEIVRLLLDAGEDPNRYNPEGNHSHSTPLHQAIWADHEDVVRLLVERGASLDIPDTVYKGTPLGWAEYGGKKQIAEYLRSKER